MSTYDNLQGALELLILKVLRRGPAHGYAIATAIQQMSDDVLRVEAGSMYPALHRMSEAGLLKAEWATSDVGRRARLYTLTRTGRRQLERNEEKWRAISAAVAKVLQSA
jgi:transcriptional regulator